MAIMYPPELGKYVRSKAELDLFNIMKRELPDDEWIALYSLGLTIHPSKPWAEIDFVIIGPPGVFCLEVKGGRVEFKGGRWHFTDRDGNTTMKNQGPFEQVGPAAAAIHRYLSERIDNFNNVPVGYGVIVPDVEWRITSPGYEPKVIYDKRDKERPFKVYVRRIAEFWTEWLKTQLGKTVENLSEHGRREVLNVLRGEFDLRPSLKTRIDSSLNELLTLTQEQYHVLDELRDNKRVLVRGGAGTGKTLLAVEETCRRALNGERVFLCCYNKNLAAFLRDTVKACRGVDTYHLHGFMEESIRLAGLKNRLPSVRQEDLLSVIYPELCLEGMMELERWQVYDSLIVDEAQDVLRDTYFDVLDALIKGGMRDGNWKMFMDPHQDIFAGNNPAILRLLMESHPAQYRLTVNCRNTDQIATATKILSGIEGDEVTRTNGVEVEQRWYRDRNDQRKKISDCINRLLSERLEPSEITILSRYKQGNSCLSRGLFQVPYPLMNVTDIKASEKKAIRFSTVAAFKGLESAATILADVDDLKDTIAKINLYVGCSRAQGFLAIFIDQGLRRDYEELAHEYGERLIDGLRESRLS